MKRIIIGSVLAIVSLAAGLGLQNSSWGVLFIFGISLIISGRKSIKREKEGVK